MNQVNLHAQPPCVALCFGINKHRYKYVSVSLCINILHVRYTELLTSPHLSSHVLQHLHHGSQTNIASWCVRQAYSFFEKTAQWNLIYMKYINSSFTYKRWSKTVTNCRELHRTVASVCACSTHYSHRGDPPKRFLSVSRASLQTHYEGKRPMSIKCYRGSPLLWNCRLL